MSRSHVNHLQLFQEERPRSPLPETLSTGALPDVLLAIEKLTGHAIRYEAGAADNLPDNSDSEAHAACETDNGTSTVESASRMWSVPVRPGRNIAEGHLHVTTSGDVTGSQQKRANSAQGNQSDDAERQLVQALAGLLEEHLRMRHALWQREAELAAGIPLVLENAPVEKSSNGLSASNLRNTAHEAVDNCSESRPSGNHLAVRLEALLCSGAMSIGCDAAALYLLDDATTSLKLRSCWGLPIDRLEEPARPLKGAVADLEAMLGSAIVLENSAMADYWHPPETFPASVCVPLSSDSTILGTLWLFSETERDFDDHETAAAEMVAGHVVAALQCETLMQEGRESARLKKQLQRAEQVQQSLLPAPSLQFDGWQIAGWSEQAEVVGGAFHDWFSLPDSRVGLILGDMMHQGLDAALVAGAARSSIRAAAMYQPNMAELLRLPHDEMLQDIARQQFGHAFVASLDPASGKFRYASAGSTTAIQLSSTDWTLLNDPTPLLGEAPDALFEEYASQLDPGELLLVYSAAIHRLRSPQGTVIGPRRMAELVRRNIGQSANELILLIRDVLSRHAPTGLADDCSILILKRT